MEYDHGGTKLEGWHAQDADKTGRRPAVLLVHQWLGITDFEKKRAEMLAELGYNVLCADVYGKVFAHPPRKRQLRWRGAQFHALACGQRQLQRCGLQREGR